MGWSGGTEIFDCVTAELMNFQVNTYDVDLPRYRMLNLLSSLKCALEDQDWDNHSESTYWTHPMIGKILGNTFEEEE